MIFIDVKKFFINLLSDSNKVSSKRFIGFIALIMFVWYGIIGIIRDKDENFWKFYISLCAITIWIAFKFMSAEKILKYNVLSELGKFGKINKETINAVVEGEKELEQSEEQTNQEKNG